MLLMGGDPIRKACFFVDEAGDLALFDQWGKTIVGDEGCSRYFIVALAEIADPETATLQIETLRRQLLDDPWFAGVPSMQPAARKTAVFFHCKDDLPEVRREVFKLTTSLPIKVQAIVRRKETMIDQARRLHAIGKRLTENEIYDDMVKRLFRNVLHKNEANHIVFARRGKSDRAEALQNAIAAAKRNFERKFGIPSDKPTAIQSDFSWNCPCLQIVDYCLWALQRLYERHEERCFRLVSKSFRLIIDMDDKRNHNYGEYYNDSNPLDVGKIKAF